MAEGEVIVGRRGSWGRRLLNELIALLLSLAILLALGLVLIDTSPGHRFLADRIAGIETATGLNIKIGRIDGSIFGEAHLKNVRVADGEGVFLTSPDILVDWAPFAWLYNSLHIDRLEADKVRLERLPHEGLYRIAHLRRGDGLACHWRERRVQLVASPALASR